ncbi:hypothetical protein GGTG_13454 [Gaeumannomyces tritici R3-111a-1]|uniref:Uncharacterized protein n=1 Tax=Gaeumannomyces tritici (strain R3-111a-1) TaxID=644352 RepID=J3PIX4_GAET3|nr:hypothetical protein GGTG_13454 [Gaeumannomyces tritici R3-111a-1]EJT68948.1 hypothetical protein GGTG_13454 [Gaeumannomyces tritici R3-111a-1]
MHKRNRLSLSSLISFLNRSKSLSRKCDTFNPTYSPAIIEQSIQDSKRHTVQQFNLQEESILCLSSASNSDSEQQDKYSDLKATSKSPKRRSALAKQGKTPNATKTKKRIHFANGTKQNNGPNVEGIQAEEALIDIEGLYDYMIRESPENLRPDSPTLGYYFGT